MRILVFSDSHLTSKFDKKKYILLKRIVSESDQVIINGDFWDGYLTTFDTFINSEWQSLFPLLKSKKAVYLFGNHDKREYADERMELFSDKQMDAYLLKIGATTYYFEHGHVLSPAIDSRISSMYIKKLMTYIAHARPMRALFRMAGMEERRNRHFKRKTDEKRSPTSMFAFGHSHFPEHDPDANFINSGFIHFGHASYIIITENSVELKKERY